MKKIPIWPTLATVGNIICGFAALAAAGGHNFERAAWLVIAAMLFDAADGRLARMTRTSSQFGAELDSLADVISFGVAPAFLIHNYTIFRIPGYSEKVAWVASGLYLVCAALRLARFNVETPPRGRGAQVLQGACRRPGAAGLMVTSVLFLAEWGTAIPSGLVAVLPFMMMVSAVLMVTRVRYPHLLSQMDVGEKPFSFVVLVVFFSMLVFLEPQVGLFIVFLFYAASGPIGLTIDQILERLATSDSDDSLF